MSAPFTSMFNDLIDARTGRSQSERLPEPERDPSLPEYVVMENSSLRWLTEAVNDRIAIGWRPIGGVSWTSNQYIQAMIKPGITPEPEPLPTHFNEDYFNL